MVDWCLHCRVLGRVPNFDVERGAGALGFSEESLFLSQLLAAGFVIVGAINVVVEHHFDCIKLTSNGLLDMARKMGRSYAFDFHHWRHQRSRLAAPRLVLCQLLRYLPRNEVQQRAKTNGNLSGRQLRLEEDMAFYREYIVQRRRLHKYSLHGLVLLRSEAIA